MKYRSLEIHPAWASAREWLPGFTRQMVAKKNSSECRAGRSDAGALPALRKPSRRSQLRALVDCLTLTRETLDLGNPFIFDEPRARSKDARARSPKRSRNPLAVLARWFASWRRELAIARGEAELYRLDDRTLRDIGIVDRSAIESFVRHGRDVGAAPDEPARHKTEKVAEGSAADEVNDLGLAGLTPTDLERARAWMLAQRRRKAEAGRTALLPP